METNRGNRRRIAQRRRGFRGLDFASELYSKPIVVVNDNEMSIAENHGGLYDNLRRCARPTAGAECNLFKAMGLDYVYVHEGNNISALINAFQQVKDSTAPIVEHITTEKGKGYAPAEENKEDWHFSGPFDVKTGKPLYESDVEDYSSVTPNIF